MDRVRHRSRALPRRFPHIVVIPLIVAVVVGVWPGQGNQRDASLGGTVGFLPAPGLSRLLVPGDHVSVQVGTPGGSLVGNPYMILADVIDHASPPPFQLPGEPGVVAVTPSLVPLVNTFSGIIPLGVPQYLPSSGVGFAVPAPSARRETSLVLQAAVADPQAPNGLAITTVTGGRFSGPPAITGLFGGSATQAQFGYALYTADLDGDGLPEIIAGAREENAPTQTDAGRVFIYSGSPPTLQQVLDDPSPEAQSHFGVSCAAGDLNGDGYMDIVVGARQTDFVQTDAGRAVVFFGPSFVQTLTLMPPTPEFRGQFGHRAVCGDFDGDGYDDLAVSSIGTTVGAFAQAGHIDVFFGPSLFPVMRVENPIPGDGDRFGYRLCQADLNDDGFDDLVVAAPFKALISPTVDDSGAIFVLLGPTFALDTYFPNPQPSTAGLLGADVSCADLDQDGDLDIIAGAELDNSGGLGTQGSVYVLRGPDFTTQDQYFSPAPFLDGGFGSGVDAGDFDGDGVPDLMVGEFFYTGTAFHSGRAHIMLGPDYLQSVTVTEPFQGISFQFGRRVRAADLDGDGFSEMLVGVPQSSASFVSRAGAIYVVAF